MEWRNDLDTQGVPYMPTEKWLIHFEVRAGDKRAVGDSVQDCHFKGVFTWRDLVQWDLPEHDNPLAGEELH